VDTGVAFYSNNPDDWGKILSKLAKSEIRNRFIANKTLGAIHAGRRILLIGITIEGLKFIESILKLDPLCRPVVYTGSTTLKRDQQLRSDLATGIINCILTVKKADKGLDLPSLDYLLLARPMNNEAGITQISGRIVRPLPGKDTPEICDCVDEGSLSAGFARNRSRWYQKLGYGINICLTAFLFSFTIYL
jgi:superfamily II DNA or RNA helicase